MGLEDEDSADAAGHPPAPTAMTAISKIETMLELLPVSHDVNTILERLLLVYDPSDVLSADEVKSYYGSHSFPASKRSLFADVPAPDAQCKLAWRKLMAFEFEGRCAKPGKVKALSVWGSIMDHANLERVDLTANVSLKGFFESEQADPIDNAVAEALLRFLEEQGVQNSVVHSLRLDRVRTVHWTGVTLLQVTSEKVTSTPSLLKDDFISQWQDLLPEPWREDATLDKLPERCYTVVPADGKATIVWNGLDQAGVNSAQKTAPDVAASASASEKTTAGKRKWHEKFKAQRKEISK
jgi:sister chromatid cohesion protein DCC1